MELDKIIDRVRKLLRMAADTSLVSRRDAETFAAQRRGREDGASISLLTQIGGKPAGLLGE